MQKKSVKQLIYLYLPKFKVNRNKVITSMLLHQNWQATLMRCNREIVVPLSACWYKCWPWLTFRFNWGSFFLYFLGCEIFFREKFKLSIVLYNSLIRSNYYGTLKSLYQILCEFYWVHFLSSCQFQHSGYAL